MKRPSLLLLALLILSPLSHAGPIYKWVDAKGNLHFSDRDPGNQQAEKIELKPISTFETVSYQRSPVDTGKEVIIYTTSWCGYCKKATAYFRQKGIAFTERDIEQDPAAARQFKQLGASGVPVILVGDRRMNGFSAAGFEQIYR